MGKRIKVNDFQVQVGRDDHMLNVYAVFKEEKRGDLFVIYTDNYDENKNKLHYGSVHMKPDTLVVIDVRGKEEVIKEFTWKLLNDREQEGFNIIDIKEFERVEIVSSNELIVKSEVISKLADKTIQEEEKKEEVVVKEKKSSRILFRGFGLALCVVIAFCIVNKDMITGKNIKYDCKNVYLDQEIGTNREDIEYLAFDFNNNLTMRTITTKIIFDDEVKYQDYVSVATYYNINSKFNEEDPKYVTDDVNKTVSIVEEVVLNENYNGKKNMDELLKELTEKNYQCTKVSE